MAIDKQKVYIMKNDLSLIKIGISDDPERRAREVSNASGFRTQVVESFRVKDGDTAYGIEQHAHSILEDQRKCGEWFDCSISHAKHVIDRLIAVGEDAIADARYQGPHLTCRKHTDAEIASPSSEYAEHFFSVNRDWRALSEEEIIACMERYSDIMIDYLSDIEPFTMKVYGAWLSHQKGVAQ